METFTVSLCHSLLFEKGFAYLFCTCISIYLRTKSIFVLNIGRNWLQYYYQTCLIFFSFFLLKTTFKQNDFYD